MNNGKELLKLVQENPDLPIVPMVDSEIVAEDGYNWWLGSFGKCYVDSYVHVYVDYYGDDRFFTKDEQGLIEEYFAEIISDDDENKELSDKEVEKRAHERAEALPWKKAIIVYIGVPEV